MEELCKSLCNEIYDNLLQQCKNDLILIIHNQCFLFCPFSKNLLTKDEQENSGEDYGGYFCGCIECNQKFGFHLCDFCKYTPSDSITLYYIPTVVAFIDAERYGICYNKRQSNSNNSNNSDDSDNSGNSGESGNSDNLDNLDESDNEYGPYGEKLLSYTFGELVDKIHGKYYHNYYIKDIISTIVKDTGNKYFHRYDVEGTDGGYNIYICLCPNCKRYSVNTISGD